MEILKDIQEFAKEKDSKYKTVADNIGSDAGHIFPFNCAPLDIILGGGIYAGKIYEIYGWESQGKSTVGLEATKAFANYWTNVVKDDKWGVLYLETESALDKVRAKWMNVPVERFLIDESECIEDGWESIKKVLERSLQKGMHWFIIWDTIGATSTRNENAKGANSGGMAERARIARQMFRNITQLIGKTDSVLFLVNQASASFDPFASDESPIPAIKFHASVRMTIRKRTDRKLIQKDGKEKVIGIYSELHTVKNKLTLPKQKCIISILGESGLDIFDTIYNYCVDNKIVNVAGGWKSVSFPKSLYRADAPNGEMAEVKFQSPDKLKEIIEVQYPHLKDWLDYLIYVNASNGSPLLKVKLIQKIWTYELAFFGEKRTVLTDKETEVASMLYKEVNCVVEKEE